MCPPGSVTTWLAHPSVPTDSPSAFLGEKVPCLQAGRGFRPPEPDRLELPSTLGASWALHLESLRPWVSLSVGLLTASKRQQIRRRSQTWAQTSPLSLRSHVTLSKSPHLSECQCHSNTDFMGGWLLQVPELPFLPVSTSFATWFFHSSCQKVKSLPHPLDLAGLTTYFGQQNVVEVMQQPKISFLDPCGLQVGKPGPTSWRMRDHVKLS